ncbi:cupin domain-containing protein [Candidatus Methanomassiliicoccus intestinalis]|mgnify:CR=1 FL=1|uniref:cupin domain-containing protein n=1 Tax=Candidatus Methanomassiliicoccus intestinalis TaxID=1406512 RepID=UPI0037DBF9C2
MSNPQSLGSRVRTYRERLGLSSEELAKNSNVEAAVLKSIEADEVYPSIGTLVRLARALGQRVGTFTDDQFVPDPIIVKAETMVAATTSADGIEAPGYHYCLLGMGKTDRHMEPYYIIVDPQNKRPISAHEGEEFIIVVNDEVELVYGKQTFVLSAGDSMYYNSVVPHAVNAANGKPATIYAVIYTPI